MNTLRLLNAVKAVDEALEAGGKFDITTYAVDGQPRCLLGHYAARNDLQDVCYIVEQLVCTGDTRHLLPFEFEGAAEHFGLSAEESILLFSAQGCGGAGADWPAARKYVLDFIAKKLAEYAAALEAAGVRS